MNRILIVFCTAAVLVSCGQPRSRDSRPTENQTETPGAPRSEKPALTGAYTAQRPLTEAEVRLFGTVTEGMTGVAYTPESVATQVVAGTNYRFLCRAVTATRTPETYRAEVIVFQPLPGQGEARITSIKRL